MRTPRLPITIITITYHFGRVILSLAFVLPYIQWKTWKAKGAFKRELVRNGIPKELADNLTDAYNSGNKDILRSVAGLPTIKRAS